MSPAKVSPGTTRGFIIPIGGAEDKIGGRAILRRFTELCGGDRARIAIIPTASQLPDTGERYAALFRDIGVRQATVCAISTRDDAEAQGTVDVVAEADGIFLTGGNQLRLSTILGGTALAQMIRRRNAAGAAVAGTSAGAGFVAEHMIAFGDDGGGPREGMVHLAPGLGLTNRILVDHHFRQRDRLGRLLMAMAYNPLFVGVGLDEDAAVFIGPDDRMDVVGSGSVTIVDPSDLEYTSASQLEPGDQLCLVNMRFHLLVDGWSYDLVQRRATSLAAAR